MKRSFIVLSIVCLACFAGIGVSAPVAPDLNISAVVNQANYKKGNSIAIALLIQAKSDLSVSFSSAKFYDLKLQYGGETVWQWSSGKMFAQSVITRNFKLEQPLLISEIIETSSLNLKPGKYTLTPILCCNPAIIGEPVLFQIK